MEYKRNITIDELTPKRLREYYLFGLNLIDSNGKQMPDDLIQNQIDGAISFLEDKCATRFQLTRVYCPPDPNNLEEDMVEGENYDEIRNRIDWHVNDQQNYGYIQMPTNRLVSVQRIRGVYDNRPIWTVPEPWIKKRLASIQIVPTITGGLSAAISSEG